MHSPTGGRESWLESPRLSMYVSSLAYQPCWGCGIKPAKGETFKACGACQQFKLVAVSFCSPECQEKHWPRHQKWHIEQPAEACEAAAEVYAED